MTPRNENAHRPGRALPTASKASGKLSPGAEDGKPGGGEPWPEPLPLPAGEDRVPELTADLLPPALRGWLADVAERMQVPLEFPTVAALVSLSSLIGRKVAIRPKRRDDWSEFGNLWGLVVGWPGILKTPAMEASIVPLSGAGEYLGVGLHVRSVFEPAPASLLARPSIPLDLPSCLPKQATVRGFARRIGRLASSDALYLSHLAHTPNLVSSTLRPPRTRPAF